MVYNQEGLFYINGPSHLFKTIRGLRYLSLKYRTVVDISIQANSFFVLPENILFGDFFYRGFRFFEVCYKI